tara:strand:- start:248 stop:1903 length:1656 start_codon:yes stop_codon:yes gene_type:complete
MLRLKSIKLYFFATLKLLFLSFRNYYLKTNFYNKKLEREIPSRIFYSPSSYLISSLTTNSNDYYKITNFSPEIIWQTNIENKSEFNNLHSFLWLTKIDRKNSKILTKDIIISWINKFFNYDTKTWDAEITSKRIIAWTSNTDITLQDSEKYYKEKFFLSLTKQINFLVRNLKTLPNNSSKIICCSAIILSGIIFSENNSNQKFGIKELEKIIKIYFDKNGFPKSRSPEELFVSLKYLILIREWFKEAHISIPEFLNDIIYRSGICYSMLSSLSKQFPLFNGSTEIEHKDYDTFLKDHKYKFVCKEKEISEFIKVSKKKFDLFMDCGNPPQDKFSNHYQAGCLSFELISKTQKIICNTGYGKHLSPKLTLLSRSTAAHSTLYINDTSSCIFQKNRIINKVYGNSLVEKHKIINKNYTENNEFYFLSASHNGYEKKFGYVHTRSIRIFKKKDEILGCDELKKTRNRLNSVNFSIRFHIYPNTKIVKTKSNKSVLISLENGEGWLLESKTNNINIENDIFLGNRNQIMKSESVLIAGTTNESLSSIDWKIERID